MVAVVGLRGDGRLADGVAVEGRGGGGHCVLRCWVGGLEGGEEGGGGAVEGGGGGGGVSQGGGGGGGGLRRGRRAVGGGVNGGGCGGPRKKQDKTIDFPSKSSNSFK